MAQRFPPRSTPRSTPASAPRRPTPSAGGPLAGFDTAAWFRVVVLSLLSLLQLHWILSAGATALQKGLSGVCLLGIVVAAIRHRADLRRWNPIAGALTIAAAANVVWTVFLLQPPYPGRMELLMVLAGHVAALIGVLAAPKGEARFGLVFALVMLLAAPLLVAEAVLQQPSSLGYQRAASNEVVMPPTPLPDGTYSPRSTVTSVYPDNPRGYFHQVVEGPLPWNLALNEQQAAAVLDRSSSGDTLRLKITRVQGGTVWHVQLTQSPLRIQAGENYRIVFRARSARRKRFDFSVSQAHPPWEGLGLYRQSSADNEWRTYDESFVATATDSMGRIQFDLGTDTTSVELSNIRLIETGNMSRVVPGGHASTFTVSYRFNDMGCRGPIRPISADSGRFRILVLGDAHTLGAGIHEQDTYSSRLEAQLNTDSSTSRARFEVINCGVTGYGTKDARLFFDRVGSRYSPDVVVIAVNPGDHAHELDDMVRPQDRSRIRHLFLTIEFVERRLGRTRRLTGEVRTIVDDVRALRDSLARRGAKLVTVLLPRPLDAANRAFTDAVFAELQPSGIPTLEIMPLIQVFQDADLVVHPALDHHLNDVGHRITGEALGRLFIQQRLIDTNARSESSPRR